MPSLPHLRRDLRDGDRRTRRVRRRGGRELAGRLINDTYDLLLTHREAVTIRGEFDLHVHHYLLALPEDDLASITVALSHPQAIAQTRGFLTRHGIRGEIGGDTAACARRVREENLRGHAAVAARRAAELYGLRIVAEEIEDNPHNFTKFLVLSRHGMAVDGDTFALPPVDPAIVKRSLVFSVPNTPGSLYKALGPIATNGLNLTKIESRPARERPWDYYFYADVEGNPADPRYHSAITELQEYLHLRECPRGVPGPQLGAGGGVGDQPGACGNDE